MAELKIKADSGGGTVSLKGPATTTSNAAVQLTLPVDDGTTGQYLKTDGSGALSWATVDTSIADDSIVEAKLDIHAAPSGTNKFLGYTSNGMEWAVPPDTGETNDFKLITTTTSSDTATTTQDGYFSSDYDTYKVIGYVSPEAQDKFNIRLQTGGSTNGSGTAGSSYTTAHYVHASHRAYNDTSNNNQFSNANTNHTDYDSPGDVIRPGFGAGADDHQEEATNTGTYMLWLFCPLQTDQWTRYYSEFIFMAASNYNRHVQEGFLKTTTAVTGFNCWYDSNNHSGKFRLYGLR